MVGVLAVLFGAPVFAELIQTYLPDTGQLGQTVFFVIFLAPLYGGAALLIREIAVRFDRGWRGRLLLAAAFGVLMPTWVDLSLFTPQSTQDIALWDQTLASTLVWGISVAAVTNWMVGHVLMSIGAPLAVVDALLPAGRGRRWLGVGGIVVLSVLCVAVAAAIHADSSATAQTSPLRYSVSLAVALGLVILAFTPFGRPVTPVPGRAPGRPVFLLLAGFVAMAGYDLVPVSWLGVAVSWLSLVTAGVLVTRLARSPEWTWRHLAAFAYGGILERTMVGFLAPTPTGADPTAKITQNVIVLLLIIGLGALLHLRTQGCDVVTAEDARDAVT